MNLEIDYNPTPSEMFFISVAITPKIAISFDYTSKGHRVIKQVLVEHKSFPENKKPTAEWDTLVINDGKFIKKYHVKWLDMDDKDWVNNEIWQTVLRQPMDKDAAEKLLYYSGLISDNYEHMNTIKDEYKIFEELLKTEINKLPAKWLK